MSIVRTIMKIVLIIIGVTAATAGGDVGAKSYVIDYYVPLGGYKDPGVGYGLRSYADYSSVPYYYDQRIGLHGFGFENRVASFADGLRNPITPKALEHVGYRSTYKGPQ